jgi:tetratricopeptide (TPR) repeat protein
MALFAPRLLVAEDGFDMRWKAANDAYQEGDYAKAREIYEALSSSDRGGASIFYNLGNAHFQLGERGRAAWAYENALRLEPRFTEARANLRLARSHIPEDDSQAFVLFRPLVWICTALTVEEWAVLFLLVSLVACLSASIWILARKEGVRRVGRIGSLIGGCLMVLVACFYLPRLIESGHRRHAVVVVAEAVVRGGPGDRHEPRFTAPEAEKLRVLESSEIAGWVCVQDPITGRTGYVAESDILELRRQAKTTRSE